MDTTTSEVTPELPVVFRGKKRKAKTYRQRSEPAGDDEVLKSAEAPQTELVAAVSDAPLKANAAPTQSGDSVDEEKGLSVAEVLRLRNARKSRLGGVKFGAGSNHGPSEAATATEGGEFLDDLSLMIREEEIKALDIASGVRKRFAVQTGQATELVNKHMEEYIEAELAKRHNAIASSSSHARGIAHGRSSSQDPRSMDASTTVPKPEQLNNRALQGQLMEIDLGDEARSRNEALTERARRRLQGESIEDEEQSGRPRKVRLGKDGKPWRSRNRRNSDDIRRDQLVEEILRENRLDVYETPTPPPIAGPSGAGTGDEAGAADDRIAEEFRREFMDAMAERQQKRKKPTNAPPQKPGKGAAKDEEVLKGPKLGGSRNVRAAMRNLLLEKAKEGKKPTR
ncbi:hepatocellular carcinoma-associated antigen 59-domain-containing protein [Hypoxylon crocopeplum]|nr:hepatocellular carcinoma-associated antigen 59-domain-containing protein [Hypoxylon crocopeplum]